MIDLVELASSINPELPEKKQKEEFCDVQVLTISFPMGTHVFDSGVSNIKGDGDNRDNTDM